MKITSKIFTLNILNGLSLGIVVALIPSALLGQLMLLFGKNSLALRVIDMTSLAQSLLPAVAAIAVATLFHFNTIKTASIALAAMIGSGVAIPTPKGFVLHGTGDIINTGLTIAIAVGLLILIGERLGQFTMLVAPALILVVAGALGLLILPSVQEISEIIGLGVNQITQWQPIVMGAVMAVIFSILVVSPISSVGIATAIGLAGIGAGAANVGIVVTSFTLAIMGARVNPLGGTLAHFIGSPKIQMANMMRNPKLFIPTTLGAAIMGAIAAMLDIKGTPFSAGFGFSGLIGPITAYQATAQSAGMVSKVLLVFVILPLLLAIGLNYIFSQRGTLIAPTDLKLPNN
ncbi:PTS sugar transporter subunit IIC [Periweissella cryptocerci]|uniref:PTS sugar transporter subunit IIC n=1 Tax=Periweissella cryptocerci TaxID=2506420 RepID=A0A4P6YU22_9LACO|nr:PTS sugar transporter subunit IIC [Periweissella cryptocerci]QBO36212.1 PTS sugar transporter subunit IIC [Periweissella cryptocerci]